jgi:recombinational DNA repair ATPase RecF
LVLVELAQLQMQQEEVGLIQFFLQELLVAVVAAGLAHQQLLVALAVLVVAEVIKVLLEVEIRQPLLHLKEIMVELDKLQQAATVKAAAVVVQMP